LELSARASPAQLILKIYLEAKPAPLRTPSKTVCSFRARRAGKLEQLARSKKSAGRGVVNAGNNALRKPAGEAIWRLPRWQDENR